MRLSDATLATVPATVRRPGYDRRSQKAGIVHFGIGAFHRAHQAVYTDDALGAGERDWGITGISLRSAGVAEQLNPQDGLFSVASRSGTATDYRVVGAVQRVLVATQSPAAVIAAVASPDTHILTFTITEKGYCRGADGDLDAVAAGPGSVYPYLAESLAQRRRQGLPGLTLLSCDNLAANGLQLRRLLGQYLAARDAGLADWVSTRCTFPSSMVDRIVPATTAADEQAAARALGVADKAAVSTEPFSQWVIEDAFAGPRPRWEAHGAELVRDVHAYEAAKLRMLNGAHSALAYLGLLRGHQFVHEAIADAAIAPLVEQLMRAEAAPSLDAAPGQDLAAYAGALLARFGNSALNHRLAQIAMDGSQKIPQRWVPTLAWHQRRGSACPSILTALAAWLLHVRGNLRAVEDPRAGELAAAWARVGRAGILGDLFGNGGLVAASWTPTAADHAFVLERLDALEGANP